MKLSAIIIEYRNRFQISQREFSRRCGLSNSYISFLENEVNPRTGRPIVPTLEQYQKLATGMNMTVQQLFEMLDEDSPVDLHADPVPESSAPNQDEIRLLIPGLSRIPREQVERTKNAFLAMFKATYPELFDKGDDDK